MERISAAIPLWNGRGAALAYVLYLVTVGLNEVFLSRPAQECEPSLRTPPPQLPAS